MTHQAVETVFIRCMQELPPEGFRCTFVQMVDCSEVCARKKSPADAQMLN